jgi:hypothetical protein
MSESDIQGILATQFRKEVEKLKHRLFYQYGDDNKYEEMLKVQKKIERTAIKEFELEILNRMSKKEKENDPILRFLQEKIKRVYIGLSSKKLDLYATLTPEQIYPIFHSWYRKTFPRDPIISFNRMKEELLRHGRLGPFKNEKWYGVRLI